MGSRIVSFGLFLLLIACIVGGAVLFGNVTGALDLLRAQQAARQAEAEAVKLQAQLDLAQAQAQIETAQGERAVLEAASRAVDSDRRLTEYYALRNDARAILALVGALGLAVCGAVIFTLIKGVGNAKNTNADQHE